MKLQTLLCGISFTFTNIRVKYSLECISSEDLGMFELRFKCPSTVQWFINLYQERSWRDSYVLYKSHIRPIRTQVSIKTHHCLCSMKRYKHTVIPRSFHLQDETY